MSSDFGSLQLADGTLTQLCLTSGEARVSLRNWREEEQVLVFHNVIGFEAFDSMGVDLSHGTEREDDEFLRRSCERAEEPPAEFRCFCFFSAWSDHPILKIAARSFSLESPQPEHRATKRTLE